ncbi:MAG: hypothetical protein KJ070_09565 [Verrucomicrobia bacterium]|nr:hypothetical protein [Verrucomicrobiota bacterium]
MTSASDHIGLLIRQEFRADGLVERVFDALNQRTEIGLSVLGERLQITRPNLVEFHYGFDEGRRAVAARDKRGLGHAARYDAEFRLVESKLADGSATINSDFDARHQRPRRSVGSGVQADRTFDAQGRLLTRDLTFSGDLRRETFTYDALDRVRTATFPSGKWEYRYDLLGPMKSATLTVQGHDYVVGQTLRADGAVTRVSYPGPEPVTVDLGRDSAGRLRTVLPQGQTPVISSSSYVGAAHIGSLLIGGNTLLDQQTVFDSRGRTLGRRYVRLTDGAVVMDVRYLHDQVNNFTVRQEMHRAGRAEVFLCDAGSRLVGAHYGARAPVAEETGRPGYTPFDLPLAAPQTFKPGYFSRAYQYDLGGLDLLLRVSELNPDNIPSWPASREFGGHDDFLVPLVVDGTQRGRDSLGNVSRTRLLIWKPGASQPTNVFATLRYNGLNQLIRLDRDDGVSLDYSYDEKGLMFQRVLHDPQLPGGVRHTVLVWDGGRLLAEYDRTGGSNQLLARYYYFIGDVPVAMDRRDAGGELHRYYFLTDALGHVVALADAGAQLVTRYAYDVWGQFRPEAPDLTLPEVARVVATVDGFQLEFTETILPGGTAPEFPQLQADTRAFGDVAEVRLDGAPVGGAWRYVESVVGRPFGSVLQFASQSPLAGNVELQLRAGVAMDEWNNRNAAKIVSFTVAAGTPPGTVLSTPAPDDPGPTTVVQLSPFQFQGQYFDPDAGLIYMRARFYNPDSGSFLQRDPEAYTDSPNLYAALGHNPVSLRDPSGRMAKPGGPRPPRPPGPPPPKTNPKPAPPAPAPQANRTPGASKTPGQTSPATAQTGGASRRFPNVEAAVEAKVRTKLKESTEDHIQSVLRTLDKNQELEFVNYGAGWDVFRVHGTSRALRIARDDNYRVLDTGQIIPDTASGIMNEKGLHKFTQTVRGHVAYDAAGLMEFRGASLKGKVTLGKRHVEFGRPVIEMHFFENASDFTPSNQRPLTRLDDEHLRLAQEVERFDRDYGDFQTLRAEINGVERLVAVDPPELKHAQFMNGLRSLKNRGRISDDEFKTYADMPRAILDANR